MYAGKRRMDDRLGGSLCARQRRKNPWLVRFILSALVVAADVFALCALSARPWERHQVLTLCLSIVAFTISGTYRWITICTTLDQRKQNRKRQKERRTGQ